MLISILYSSMSTQDKFIILAVYIVGALLAITIHEVAHGYVAKLNGDNTAEMYGRLTLNPAKHFNLVGFLMFVLVGFGWAKPVPINPNNFKDYKKGVITVSLAGVFTNLIASFVSFGLLALTIKIGTSVGIENMNEVGYVFYKLAFFFFMYGSIINISLIAFNILPVYPLDGFNVLAMLTKPNNRLVLFLRKYGYTILIVLLLIGSVFPMFDVIGMYFSAIQNFIITIFSSIFGNII